MKTTPREAVSPPRRPYGGHGRVLAAVTILVVAVAAIVARSGAGTEAGTVVTIPGPGSGLQPNGRLLRPHGTQVSLGNYPTGGAVTADGKFLWTVSTGTAGNDVRIVDTTSQKVCQVIDLPGASGGIALDSTHRRAYVSGLPNSRWQPSMHGLAGANGNVVLVYAWGDECGQATLDRVIPVPPQPGAPTVQVYPPPRAGLAGAVSSWPQKLAVSPDGSQLLVPLNLANSAALIDVSAADQVRYVPTGSYPHGAAVSPDGAIGLVTNEASGKLSVIDLTAGTKLTDITVGAPLSHPQGVVVDADGRRAYVAVSASDQVTVVNLESRMVERTIAVGRPDGLGTMPVALALDPDGTRLYVAESGADEIAVVQLPAPSVARDRQWDVIGHIPTAAQPQAVVTAAADGTRPAQVMVVAAEGLGVGPNLQGPVPVLASDPIYWAFNPRPPTTDVFDGVEYLPNMVTGLAGLMPVPTDTELGTLETAATKQLEPTDAQSAPADTPLRADGPIKHVFFIVRENRSYDQLLGDVTRGNGDPKLTLFGENVTPNMHAMVERFPLLDNLYANSEASIQGHYWTAATIVPDYVNRNWVQQYAGRGRPNDFGTFAVTWPGNGFLFDQAERQGIEYFNYGEAFMGGFTSIPDRDRSPEQLAEIARVQAKSDFGPPFGGCFPGDMSIGLAADNQEVFDSHLPAGAPAGSYSRMDCFRERFASQLAADDVPALSYISMTSDHTRGTQPGFPTPTAMVADSDQALGELVDLISHSPVWSSSAIFVVEDDSQDGADHVNAHRIPALVISPYARRDVVLHTRYDLLSVVRSIELIIGMDPLSLNDALATPLYDAFSATPDNAAPISGTLARVDLLERNDASSPDAEWSSQLALGELDQVPQRQIDMILWHSVHGVNSTPPPPGPGAEGAGGDGDGE